MTLIKLLLLLLCCLGLSSCASFIHGPKQDVSITTDPPNAVISDETTTIKSPGKINLERKKDHLLTITKPGYKNECVHVKRVISGAVFGNIILPVGIVCWGIDALSGAQWRLEPETLIVTLHPAKGKELINSTLCPALLTIQAKFKELARPKEKKSSHKRSLQDIGSQSSDGFNF